MDTTQKANALHELRIKRVQLNDALVLALGLTFDATTMTSTPNIPVGDVTFRRDQARHHVVQQAFQSEPGVVHL